jgi:hypothetical protein
LLRKHHAVAAGCLGAIERGIGIGQHQIGRNVLDRPGSANADRSVGRTSGHFGRGLFKGSAHTLGDADRDGAIAGNDRSKLFTAQAADNVIDAHICAGGLGEGAQRLVADCMAIAVIDPLEIIKVKHQQRHRTTVAAALADQLLSALKECTPVEQPCQWVERGGVFVKADIAILHQRKDEERGSDRIEQRRQRQCGEPRAGGVGAHGPWRQRRKQDRAKEHARMQQRDQRRLPAWVWPRPPIAPDLKRGHEGVDGNADRTEQQPAIAAFCKRRPADRDQPDDGARDQRQRTHRSAVEQARAGPDHAQRQEQECARNLLNEWHAGAVSRDPRGHRRSADNIGGAPPGQRAAGAIGNPRQQQEHAEQSRHPGGDHQQGPQIQRQGKARSAVAHHPNPQKPAFCAAESRHCAAVRERYLTTESLAARFIRVGEFTTNEMKK